MKLLYFAWVRERIGLAEEDVMPPADVATVADLVAWLAPRSPGHAAAFADPARLRAAVDQAFVPLDTPVAGAREVAIFPPVTGG
ncbi:molybdopterin converting factor subunit 1 [Sphingomonas endophytica]|uniref:Molybdopterin synthase sulfur carrier subunit n=1 Tax=Sphingomonas endophytica TaxID=869719 RepID=A0A7X0JA27_9SPHN|nr:molybdopterin converting factor subunit 1 [Sphingomonas endophytica]MBB5724537.1 molybdopterin synthase sulfur carrier subunit [Sphingomonas endophytica]MBB6503505.1 molybdopterin synthase sulfur carrier subunit [Sphingomonas endophytica]